MKIVFIHGRSQEGKDPNILKQLWIDALIQGAKKAGSAWTRDDLQNLVEFPYYGDELIRRIGASRSKDEENLRSSGDFIHEVDQELSEKAAKSDAYRATRSRDDEHRFSAEEQPRGVLNWRATHLVLGGIDKVSSKTSSGIISLALRDVGAYLENGSARKSTDEIVAKSLTKVKSKGSPVLVVAHSLGTITAFSVLHSLSKDNGWTNPIHLITLGSPLAIDAVKRRMNASGWLPFSIPKCVVSWLNGADTRDIVALNPVINRKTFFSQSEVLPFDVTNLTDIDNQTDNRHGIEGYLNDASVARYIFELIKRNA